MAQRVITFADGDSYMATITRKPDRPTMPVRYEVEVEEGVSTGECDAYGDNATHAWTFPCSSVDEAASEFASRIEEIRADYGYPN